MVVRKLDDHPDYKPCYVLEVSQQLLSQIDEIREWLRCQNILRFILPDLIGCFQGYCIFTMNPLPHFLF